MVRLKLKRFQYSLATNHPLVILLLKLGKRSKNSLLINLSSYCYSNLKKVPKFDTNQSFVILLLKLEKRSQNSLLINFSSYCYSNLKKRPCNNPYFQNVHTCEDIWKIGFQFCVSGNLDLKVPLPIIMLQWSSKWIQLLFTQWGFCIFLYRLSG